MSIAVGTLKFNAIPYRDEAIATVLQAFVIAGSQVGTVTMSDLQVNQYLDPMYKDVVEGEEAEEAEDEGEDLKIPAPTIESLLQGGTCIMDAVLYLSAPLADRFDPHYVFMQDPGFSVDQVGRDVFVLYFALLSQARPVSAELNMASFLRNVLGVNEPPSAIAGRLASFDLAKMRHGWIKHIEIKHLGIEARNRFALGVAGYRLPSALIYNEPDSVYNSSMGVKEQDFNRLRSKAIAVRGIIKHWLETGLHWYAHPLFRSAEFITRLKSFNKACSDMLIFLFSHETLANMKSQRVIYDVPKPDPRARNWNEWSATTFEFQPDPIFK